MYICIYRNTFAHTHTYIYIHTHMYIIDIHTYIHCPGRLLHDQARDAQGPPEGVCGVLCRLVLGFYKGVAKVFFRAWG